MTVQGSILSYPTGPQPQQLYTHARTLVDQLNRLLASGVGSASSGDLTQLETDLADLQTQVTDLIALIEGIEGSGLSPQQAFELSLITAVDTVLGSLSNAVTDQIRRSELAAEATIRSLLEGRKNLTRLTVEQSVRQTATDALAQQITTLQAQINLSQASIVDEATARAAADTALAESVTTVSTSLNGNVAQTQLIQSSVDGIESQIGLSVNSNGHAIGLLTLDGSPLGSNLTFVGDNFRIAREDVTGGAPVPVFTISTANGATKLVLRGDMYADSAILARMIAAGQITADKIAANAVTAEKINVTALSALTANLGTVTAGLIRNNDDTLRFDLPNMRIYRTDGTMEINFNTKLIYIRFD